MGAAIEGPAARLGRLIAPGSKGKLLDIGCGFGFAMAAVQGMTGWTARGFEPSQYGAAGRDLLGLDIVNGFAVRNADPTELYDIVHCSEVIEHVPDAGAFLDLLVSYLAPDGVLVLTTPDAELVTPRLSPQLLLPALSPGAHTVLFSEPSMLALLKRAGLPNLLVEHTGISKLYYASRRPISLGDPDVWRDRMLAWMAEAAEAAEDGSSLAAGLRFRAFRGAMDYGRYELAGRLYRPDLAAVEVPKGAVADIAAFAARWPFCIAASTYYAGMFMLLHRADRETAAKMFEVAHRLCLAKLELAPHVSVVEADLVWRAVYHRALAQAQSGHAALASETLRAFDDTELRPPVPADLIPAITALRKALSR
ncbi:class I SAM-dependent methyltransferase [Devosia sp.]|uniref:class I SAM-dependent methyltransferase n=1 Tax=Devosia sp. TaxID=1871048 RepID=UPI0035ADA975